MPGGRWFNSIPLLHFSLSSVRLPSYAAGMDEVRVEYKRLADLARWPRNPKAHDIPQLKSSLRRFGFVLPLVEDAKSEQLVAGHGRLEALLEMQADEEPPPARVKVGEDGGWLVPVVAGVSFASEREAEAYLLADNRLVEVGGWDAEKLTEILKDFQLQGDVEGIGWSMEDLDKLMATAQQEELRGPTPDERAVAFEAGVIKQIVLYFRSAEFDKVVERLQKVMDEFGVDNHTDALLKLLEEHEASRRDPDAT